MTYKIRLGGAGNASTKRARHGCEKRWNKFNEPFTNLLKGTFHMTEEYLNRKYVPTTEDYEYEMATN